jgi:hemerythrin
MRDAGVHTDHHIHQRTHSGCIGKVAELIAKMSDAGMGLQCGLVCMPHFFLQAHIVDVCWQISQQVRKF